MWSKENTDENNKERIRQLGKQPSSELTKLEYFSGLALQSLAGPSTLNGESHETICEWSVELAKELIKQINSND